MIAKASNKVDPEHGPKLGRAYERKGQLNEQFEGRYLRILSDTRYLSHINDLLFYLSLLIKITWGGKEERGRPPHGTIQLHHAHQSQAILSRNVSQCGNGGF